ncbi:MAG: MoaD/ThiS family protein [Bacteroidia bacterium]|nr:MoaD/ThiS family protein [Bacteroidia bacterium]
MKINLVAFGITKDILGAREVEYSWEGAQTVGGLLKDLGEKYPQLVDLTSLKVAVNNEYADNTKEITEKDEVVLIPPVSGG